MTTRAPHLDEILAAARQLPRKAQTALAETLLRDAAAGGGVTFEVDHIIPRAAGGKTTLGNLCLRCPTCNRHKAARLHAPDPQGGETIPLFHSIRDTWEEHFEWREEATILAGRTARQDTIRRRGRGAGEEAVTGAKL